VGQNDVVGGVPARPAGFQQRGVKPAAVLIGAFEVHYPVMPAILRSVDTGKAREVLGVFQREGMRRP